jgi:hypothetical protein
MDFLKLIQEGRVDDFKSKYGKKFSPENLNKIIEKVPQKYFDWVGKVFDNINFDENFAKLVDAIERFDKVSTNLSKTDINQYQNFDELVNAIVTYHNRDRRDVKKVEGGNVVYDDGKFFVVNPLTHDASCYYGKGTKWCTAAESDYQFKRYNEDGKLFYILDRTKATSDPLYKVALLRKFDGDTIYYDAKDDAIKNGWILNTSKINEIISSVDSYLQQEYGQQLKIYSDKASAKKEKERLERLREQQRVQGMREAAQERREDGDWDLNGDCPEEGLRAHALLKFLVENSDVSVLTNDDRADILRINNEIEALKGRYDDDEREGGPDENVEILDEIESLEEELTAYDGHIDVYNIVPVGQHYNLTEFEVIDADLDGRRYGAGDDDDMQKSCYDYVDNLIDDIGYRGFNSGFAQGYLDTEAIVREAEDVFENDVRDSPESYFSDEDRMLSEDQEEKIEILNNKIEKLENHINDMESHMDGGEGDESIQDKIDELNELIEEFKEEIEEIETNPEGDFPEDMIEDKINELVRDVRYDPEDFINDYGLDWENFIDRDDFIQGVIDADGYGATISSYDGDADEVYVEDELFYVIRIE